MQEPLKRLARRVKRQQQGKKPPQILLVNKYIHAGMTPEEAHIAAQRQLGNVTLAREEIHQMSSILWLEGLFQDLRYALRQLRSGPAFAAVVVSTGRLTHAGDGIVKRRCRVARESDEWLV